MVRGPAPPPKAATSGHPRFPSGPEDEHLGVLSPLGLPENLLDSPPRLQIR